MKITVRSGHDVIGEHRRWYVGFLGHPWFDVYWLQPWPEEIIANDPTIDNWAVGHLNLRWRA